jgi:hypothetical protein
VVNPVDVLSKTERDIVQVLLAHGGTMRGSELKSVCSGMGVKRPAFYRYLVYSPIISWYERDVYGLIG